MHICWILCAYKLISFSRNINPNSVRPIKLTYVPSYINCFITYNPPTPKQLVRHKNNFACLYRCDMYTQVHIHIWGCKPLLATGGQLWLTWSGVCDDREKTCMGRLRKCATYTCQLLKMRRKRVWISLRHTDRQRLKEKILTREMRQREREV